VKRLARHGPRPAPRLAAEGTVRGVFFSLGTTPSRDPRLDCAGAILDLLNGAKESVHVAIFTLTEPRLVKGLAAAQARGVKVSLVADAGQTRNPDNPGQARMLRLLERAGVEVRLALKQKALLHNKVAIYDGRTVSTGSFNWTFSAERLNDENLVVLEGVEVAAAFETFVFRRIFDGETVRLGEATSGSGRRSRRC
jgi:phosphatidylserine/phosphatidylglycerophosphate/cardiolipin synthase-like enzyme